MIFCLALYFLPTFLALARKRTGNQMTAIVLVNIFLGWTIIGWFAAIILVYIKYEHDR